MMMTAIELRTQFGSPSQSCARKSSPTASSALLDRKSTRLNSSHLGISYAVFCLKKKNVMRLRVRGDYRVDQLGLKCNPGLPGDSLEQLALRKRQERVEM